LDPTTRNTCTDINECATSNGGCAQTCTNSPGKFACSCGTGYKLNAYGRSCDDVNECATSNGGCNQKCTNAVGSYKCWCNVANYSLLPDGHTCYSLLAAPDSSDATDGATAGPVVAGVVVAVLLVGLLVVVVKHRRDATIERPVVEAMAVNPKFDFNEDMEYIPETDLAQTDGVEGSGADEPDAEDVNMAPGTIAWDVAHPDWVDVAPNNLEHRHGDFKTVDFSTAARAAVLSAWTPSS